MNTEHTTSTGHDLADSSWLDQHFNFSREAYEAMVRWVGFQPGWHVLDAGCGSGSFLPLLADEVGPTGKLSALDFAPENISEVEARISARPLLCEVEARVGSVLTLPYADRAFDAVWNANVSQYLTDDELRQMLAEMKRVTKPGGSVAVKEYLHETWYDTRINHAFNRLVDVLARAGDVEMQGILRAIQLPRYLRDSGLQDVRRAYFGVDKSAPLNANDLAFRMSVAAYFSGRAADGTALSADDRSFWSSQSDPQQAAAYLHDRDFHIRVEYIQVVGRVP